MGQTRFTEKTMAKLKHGEWTDQRYPNLRFRVGKKARTWVYRPPRLPDGTRPGGKLGRYPDLNLEAAVRKYEAERGRLARGEPHPDVEKRIQELEAELRALKRLSGKLVTFGDLAERFLEEYLPKSGRPLAPRTRHRYSQLLRDHALPLWADSDVEQIEDTEVKALLAEIKKAGTPFAANHLLKLLKTVFSFGIKQKLTTVNPCATIAKLRDNERTRVLSPDELRLAWTAFSELNEYGAALQLLAVTWQRRKEVAELPWSEIQGEWWSLPGTRTKNGKPNLIYLTPLARGILDRRRSCGEPSKYVFRGQVAKDQPVSDGHVYQLCREVSDRLLEAGEIQSPFHVHDLRRTAATLASSQGVNRRVVSRILNHGSKSVTDIYDLYSMQPEIQQAFTLWDEYLSDLLGVKPSVG